MFYLGFTWVLFGFYLGSIWGFVFGPSLGFYVVFIEGFILGFIQGFILCSMIVLIGSYLGSILLLFCVRIRGLFGFYVGFVWVLVLDSIWLLFLF